LEEYYDTFQLSFASFAVLSASSANLFLAGGAKIREKAQRSCKVMKAAIGYNRNKALGVKLNRWMVNLGRSNESEETRDNG
jgi:hypothetical protein